MTKNNSENINNINDNTVHLTEDQIKVMKADLELFKEKIAKNKKSEENLINDNDIEILTESED
jgi:predicted RNA binding protein with dsRBD fold (UPF0201 family)